MSKVDDGGMAFPCCVTSECTGSNGMSLRDYFAAKALAALILETKEDWTYESVADEAYEMADAMIVRRKE